MPKALLSVLIALLVQRRELVPQRLEIPCFQLSKLHCLCLRNSTAVRFRSVQARRCCKGPGSCCREPWWSKWDAAQTVWVQVDFKPDPVAAMMVTLVMVSSLSYALLSQLGFAVYCLIVTRLLRIASRWEASSPCPEHTGLRDWQATQVGLKSICFDGFGREWEFDALSYSDSLMVFITYHNHRTLIAD